MKTQMKFKPAKLFAVLLAISLLFTGGPAVFAQEEAAVVPTELSLSGNVPQNVYFDGLFKIGDTYLACAPIPGNGRALYASTDLETWDAVYDSGGGTARYGSDWRNAYRYNSAGVLTWINRDGERMLHYSTNGTTWYEIDLSPLYDGFTGNPDTNSEPSVHDDWFLTYARWDSEEQGVSGKTKVFATKDFTEWNIFENAQFPSLDDSTGLSEADLAYKDGNWYIYSTNRSSEWTVPVYDFYRAAALPTSAESWTKIGSMSHSINEDSAASHTPWLYWTEDGHPIINVDMRYYTSADWTDWAACEEPDIFAQENALSGAMQDKVGASMSEQGLFWEAFTAEGNTQVGLYSNGRDKSVLQLSTNGGETFTPITARVYYGDTLVSPKETAPASNASLSALSLSSGTLSPAFNAATKNYTASVANGVSSVIVTATAVNPLATVTGSGISIPASLNIGANTLNITVIAEDGVTTATYSIVITRAASDGNGGGGGGGGFTPPPAVTTPPETDDSETPPTSTGTAASGGSAFADVPAGSWFGDAVSFVNELGIMGGSGNAQTFQPQQTMTRAMLITALARYDGVDTGVGETWYSAAVSWGIANGVTDGSGLNDDVTREQIVTMLWRYAGQPQGGASFDGISDAAGISPYAADAFKWAIDAGIITGYDDNTVRPQNNATRAEVATILMRYIQMPE